SRARTAAALLLLCLLGAISAVQPLPAASAAASTSPSVSLGFGPSALFPAAGGAPVYTVGETLWVESNYTYAVPLTLTPGGSSSSVVAQTTLEPETVVPVYTFAPSDPEGVWNITLQTDQAKLSVPVRLVNLADHRPLLSGGLQYGLDGGNLSISAQANLAGFYDTEACAVGSAPQPVNVALPRQMGDYGNITLGPGAPLGVSTLGVINESVSFWLELYQSYSLDSGGTNLVAPDLLAARSIPVDITTNGPMNTTLAWNAPLRAGRYDLRSYFENSTGIAVFQTRVLVLNSSVWVPLSSVCPPQQESSGISYSAPLTGGQASWPRELYYMYRTLGIEAVASFPVNPDLSSVNFV
ncbi:MAG TPA: hypothetical protein VJR06_05130, partial [Nitrososphaerales archaeon]|nr:hypothetical protein [Nitrososphaerales archaeon]